MKQTKARTKARTKAKTLSGWGRYPRVSGASVLAPANEAELRQCVLQAEQVIARGNGRSYGDAALGLKTSISTAKMNRLLDFDDKTGALVVESGVLLADILDIFLPRGWFPPVTPGTKFVTVGGMVAADVHGKNHHLHGTFGSFVNWLDVMLADGRVVRCSLTEHADLFYATIGGMGLSGIILRISFTLQPVETAWIRQRVVVSENLAETLAAFEQAEQCTYSVAWIDCQAKGRKMGRSLLYCGEHAKVAELDAAKQHAPLEIPLRRKKTVPFDAPVWALNSWVVRAFNALYYWRGKQAARQTQAVAQLVDWDTYFYPLDAILHWNRIYGRRGFVQFQCVLPKEQAQAGLAALLHAIAQARQGSFLAVLKLLGKQDSFFSFPMEGYTLGVDLSGLTGE